jgi:hypothetical protein
MVHATGERKREVKIGGNIEWTRGMGEKEGNKI